MRGSAIRPTSIRRLVVVLGALSLGAAACSSDDAASSATGSEASSSAEPVALRLVTHDSFVVTEGIFDSFTEETGHTVEVISGGDAGEIVSRAILTVGEPEGDVLFGVDNTFLQRALDAEVFLDHESPLLESVPDELELDPAVTPIDVGNVCVNYTLDGPQPAGLEDLADPEFASAFVTMNPETSSPGFAFLLATIATFGEDGWEDYWQRLTDGGVTVTSGWNEAYNGEFISGGGEKTLVTSYATSPIYEVLYAEPAVDQAPTAVLLDSCFRQIEFAGVLAGTDNPGAAGQLIDFMLSPTFQADIPLNMFVAPANEDVPLPEAFIEHGVEVSTPLTLSPAEIEANRLEWTDRWTEIVLR